MSDNLSVGINVNSSKNYNIDNTLPDISGQNCAELTKSMWGIDSGVIKEISNMNRVYSSKHGLFASVPIICKGPDCTYKDVCMVSQAQRVVGHRCPMEIAAVLARYEQWCTHFEISTVQDVVDSKDLVDATLIKDLVNIEVQMLRAENKIALNGDFMSDTLLDIDKKCQPYFGKIVSSEVEFLMTLQDKKIKILNQLNATRKDKAADKRKDSASDEAVRIFQQIKELEKQQQIINVTDLEFEDDGTIREINEDENSINELIQPGGEENGTPIENS